MLLGLKQTSSFLSTVWFVFLTVGTFFSFFFLFFFRVKMKIPKGQQVHMRVHCPLFSDFNGN
jgi:hypothetical protein